MRKLELTPSQNCFHWSINNSFTEIVLTEMEIKMLIFRTISQSIKEKRDVKKGKILQACAQLRDYCHKKD